MVPADEVWSVSLMPQFFVSHLLISVTISRFIVSSLLLAAPPTRRCIISVLTERSALFILPASWPWIHN